MFFDHLPRLDDFSYWLSREVPLLLIPNLFKALRFIFLIQGHQIESRVRSPISDKIPCLLLIPLVLLGELLGVSCGPGLPLRLRRLTLFRFGNIWLFLIPFFGELLWVINLWNLSLLRSIIDVRGVGGIRFEPDVGVMSWHLIQMDYLLKDSQIGRIIFLLQRYTNLHFLILNDFCLLALELTLTVHSLVFLRFLFSIIESKIDNFLHFFIAVQIAWGMWQMRSLRINFVDKLALDLSEVKLFVRLDLLAKAWFPQRLRFLCEVHLRLISRLERRLLNGGNLRHLVKFILFYNGWLLIQFWLLIQIKRSRF